MWKMRSLVQVFEDQGKELFFGTLIFVRMELLFRTLIFVSMELLYENLLFDVWNFC